MMYAADNNDILFPFLKSPTMSERYSIFRNGRRDVPLIDTTWDGKAPLRHRTRFSRVPRTHFMRPSIPVVMYWPNESLHSRSNVNYSSYFL
jgi:hypothetical protein